MVVVEGISACGKSHLIEQLAPHLLLYGHSVYVFEWNSNRVIRALTAYLVKKRWLTTNIYSFLQWISFMVDYFCVIIPKLVWGHTLICDRYIYTGLVRDEANQANLKFGNWLLKWARKPDLVFFVDRSPEECYQRMLLRGKKLFHMNQAILNNEQIKNKDLFYLRRCQRIYHRIFSQLRRSQSLQIHILRDGWDEMLFYVDSYFTDHQFMETKAR